MNTPDLVLQFGSRSGSAFALVFFGCLFALLGGGVTWEWRRRRGPSRWAAVLGLLLFLGPLALVYSSSLGGFYEVRLSRSGAVFGFLMPSVASSAEWSDIAAAQARPAFKGLWRLHVRLTSGKELVSATWQWEPVETAARELSTRLAPQADDGLEALPR